MSHYSWLLKRYHGISAVLINVALSRISPRVRVWVSVSIVYRIATGGYSWIWPLNVLVNGTSHSLLNFGYFFIALATVYSISGVCLRRNSGQFSQQNNGLWIDVLQLAV